MNYIVGAAIWGEYMPEEFFNMTMTTPWIYSAIYNGFYVFISMGLCLVVEAMLFKSVRRFLTGEDLKE